MDSIVKTEPMEVNEEDVDEDFINRYMEDGGKEELEEEPVAKKKANGKRSTRGRTRKIKVIVRKDKDNSEEEEPDDWKPSGVRKGTPKGKRKSQKLSAEEKRERDRERKRKMREQHRKMKEDTGGAISEVAGERPKRSSAKLRVSSGNNVEDTDKQDGDWAPENDDEEEDQEEKPRTAKSSRKRSSGAGGSGADRNARRRVSNLTPEQAEALRQKKRDYRLRLKLMREQSGGGETDGDSSEIKMEVDEIPSKRASASSGGGRRKNVSEMTEEEKEVMRLKWREEARQRRAARQTTPATGGKRVKREVLDIEEIRRRDRERQRRKRAAKTPEERQEENRRLVLNRIMKRATMTDEELQEERQRNYFKRQAKLAMMSEEERHALREKLREYNKPYVSNRNAKLLEKVGPEGVREKRRKAWREMDPLKKQQHLDQCREYYRRKMERIKADPQKHAEMLKSWKESRLRRNRGIVLRTVNRQRKPEQEVKLELKRVLDKKRRMENKLERWRTFFESGVEEAHAQLEADPERQRECIRKRIAKAKGNLRARLEASGASIEEISQRLQELESTFTTVPGYRPYKPRTEAGNPVGPGDIAKLESDIQELGRLAGKLAKGQKVESPLLPPAIPARPRLPKVDSGKREPTSIQNLDIPPSPRKRGRRPKQPQPSTSSSAITQRTPAVKPSAAETPKKMGQMNPPPASFLQPHQYQLPYTTSGIYSTQSAFPYNPHQSISNVTSSLQQDLESISYQGISTAATSAQQVPGHQNTGYEASVSSSEHDDHYASSSYFDDDAPLSPGGNYDNYSDSSYHNPAQQPEQPSYSQPVVTKVESAQPTSSFPFQSWALSSFAVGGTTATTRGRPKGSVRKPKSYVPRTGRTRNPESTAGKVICDECGGYFIPANLRNHKNEVHNPNFDRINKKCRLCGEHFTRGRNWYNHYRSQHKPTENSPSKAPRAGQFRKSENTAGKVVCDECGEHFHPLDLRSHKNEKHNPNFDLANKKCRLCGEHFAYGRKWYSHYMTQHVRPTQPPKEKPCVCEHCGQSFAHQSSYNYHVYYMHGEGTNPENFIKCDQCPPEVKGFKTRAAYGQHLQRCHPEIKKQGHECFRCDESFLSDKQLSDHVAGAHPDSFFPCPYCRGCRFTEMGLHFHFYRCSKIGNAERKRLKEEWTGGLYSVEMWPIQCEFCKNLVTVASMGRHFKELHNVTEDQFTCEVCKKVFKRRQFWVSHLEERHQKSLEEMKAYVGKLNAKNREGLCAEPRKFLLGRNSKMNKESQGIVPVKREKKETVPRRKGPKMKEKKRKVRVVCEEDELEEEMGEGFVEVKLEVCESEEDSAE